MSKEKKTLEEILDQIEDEKKNETTESVDYSDLCAVRTIMDAAKVPPKRRGKE